MVWLWVFFFVFCFIWFFETELASNSQRSAGLCLPGAGLKASAITAQCFFVESEWRQQAKGALPLIGVQTEFKWLQ